MRGSGGCHALLALCVRIGPFDYEGEMLGASVRLRIHNHHLVDVGLKQGKGSAHGQGCRMSARGLQ